MTFKSENITYLAIDSHQDFSFCSCNGHQVLVGPHKIRKLPCKTVQVSVWIQDLTVSGAYVIFVNFYSG